MYVHVEKVEDSGSGVEVVYKELKTTVTEVDLENWPKKAENGSGVHSPLSISLVVASIHSRFSSREVTKSNQGGLSYVPAV